MRRRICRYFREYGTHATICALMLGCGGSGSTEAPSDGGGSGGDVASGMTDGGPADAKMGTGDAPGGDDGATGGGDSAPPGDDSSVGEAGNVPEGSVGDDGGDAGNPGTPYFGKVVFEQYDQGNAVYTFVSVNIDPSGVLRSALVCPPGSVASGACCYKPASSGMADAGGPTGVSAGTVLTEDNGTLIQSFTYGPNGYAFYSTSGVFWGPSDQLQVQAQGATVQAFSGAVAAPPPLTGLMPAKGSTTPASLSADFPVRWGAGPAGSVIIANILSSGHGYIQCSADDAAGTATFPAAMLGNFTTTDTGTLVVARAAARTTNAANATIEVSAFSSEASSLTFTP
jgi:hypothetical protein